MNVRKVVKKVGFFLCFSALCGLIVLLLFEGLYRWQIVDTYLPELRSYNSQDALLGSAEGQATILAMGDSFTAGQWSYPRHLQELLPDYRVVNAGVSGTGVIQASLMAPRRFKTFKPSLFIYQIYLGNDLINIRYPINWRTLSPLRNLYGLVVDRFRSVSFLNYRFGQLWYSWRRPAVPLDSVPEVINPPFSPESYSPLQKNYIRADSLILENQILVAGDRQEAFDVFLKHLKALVAYCSEGSCEAYILILPHATQAHPRYLGHMRQLGAHFSDYDGVSAEDYPFVTRVKEAFAGVSHVRVLNPLLMLQEHEHEGQTLYSYNDGHLNLEGQAVLAAYLKEHLESGGRP